MPNSINETIRILRNLRGYKQSYMAFKMGISQQDYSHLEKHSKKITVNQIILICEILEVNEDFITQFDSTLFFKQKGREQTNYANIDDLLGDIDRIGQVIGGLKANIIGLLASIHGLNNQVKEQTQTIINLEQELQKK